LLAKFGVPVPAGPRRDERRRGVAAAGTLPGPLYVVKAQIHAGGRGKGKFKELGPDAKGGVRLARTPDEVRAAASEMLGNTLVTIQTGPQGKQVNRLYIHRRRRHREGVLPRASRRPEDGADRLRRLDRRAG
jgi:succinyl-CoA synthetase beta subunit